jgi:transposase-like protein
MAKPLSPDLRVRIVRAVEDEGMSCRGAASRFGVAPSTAIELVSEWRSTGACEARVQGGDRRSARIESCCRDSWPDRGHTGHDAGRDRRPSVQSPRRALRTERDLAVLRSPQHDDSKKTSHASEQEQPDVARRTRRVEGISA